MGRKTTHFPVTRSDAPFWKCGEDGFSSSNMSKAPELITDDAMFMTVNVYNAKFFSRRKNCKMYTKYYFPESASLSFLMVSSYQPIKTSTIAKFTEVKSNVHMPNICMKSVIT